MACGLYYGALRVKVFSCSLSQCFVIHFKVVITSLGEEGAGLCVFRLLCTCELLSFFSSSWCQGLAAVCDSGTPWTFQLTFFWSYIYLM